MALCARVVRKVGGPAPRGQGVAQAQWSKSRTTTWAKRGGIFGLSKEGHEAKGGEEEGARTGGSSQFFYNDSCMCF